VLEGFVLVKLQETIKKYMNSALVVVAPTATLAQVAKSLAEKDTDIAVVKSGKEIVGVITDSDIFHSMKSYVFQDVLEDLPKDVAKVKVEEIMDGKLSDNFMSVCQLTGLRPCLMVGEEETVENAIKTMGASEAHHLLVIGSDGSVSGTLSAHDLLKSFAE
jgi:CBS domain-containing protein